MNESAITYHIKADTTAIVATTFAAMIFVVACCSQIATTTRAAALTKLVTQSEQDVTKAAANCQKTLDDAFKEEKKPK